MPRKPKQQQIRQPRTALYGRVSTTEQLDGYSIDEQVRICREYADRVLQCPVQDNDIYLDEGLSATPRDIAEWPALARLHQDVLTNKFSSIVTHKVDRLSRNIELFQRILNDCDAHGTTVYFVDQNMSTDQGNGRVMANLYSVFAEMYSKNLASEVRKGLNGRLRAGKWVGGIPTGYQPDHTHGLIEDPATAPIVRRAFVLRAQNLSYQEVTDTLNNEGYRLNGDLITRCTIQQILSNRVYLGEISDCGKWLPGKHQPIIEESLFHQVERVNTSRQIRRCPVPRNTQRRVFGRGIMRCATCYANGYQSAFQVQSYNRKRTRLYYRCGRAETQRGCNAAYVCEQDLIEQMKFTLAGFALPPEDQERLLSLYQEQEQQTPERDIDQEIRKAQALLERQKKLFLLGDWSYEEYMTERANTLNTINVLDSERTPVAFQEMLNIQNYVVSTQDLWEDADDEDRADLVQLLFQSIWVAERRIIAVEPSMAFRPYFNLHRELGDEIRLSNPSPLSDILPSGLIYPQNIPLPQSLPPHEERCLAALEMRHAGKSYREIKRATHFSYSTLAELFKGASI